MESLRSCLSGYHLTELYRISSLIVTFVSALVTTRLLLLLLRVGVVHVKVVVLDFGCQGDISCKVQYSVLELNGTRKVIYKAGIIHSQGTVNVCNFVVGDRSD